MTVLTPITAMDPDEQFGSLLATRQEDPDRHFEEKLVAQQDAEQDLLVLEAEYGPDAR